MSKRKREHQRSRKRHKVNAAGSRDSLHRSNKKHKHESVHEHEKDPHRDRERLNRSMASGNVSSQGSSVSTSRSLRQPPITWYTIGQDLDKELKQEFNRWERVWEHNKDFRVVHEIQGNLFEQPKNFSLAHCVAEDLRMGRGIAVDFKDTFKNLSNLLDQGAQPGGLATLHDRENKRFLYYLVTKRESTKKPTYETLWSSLTKMRTHITQNEVKKIAIPRLACGLDRLQWNKVKSMIEHLFSDVAVEITVCNFQQDKEVPKKSFTCRLVVEKYPITKIEAHTVIFYFSTENGDVDENMQEMSKKFSFLSKFKNHRSKNLGEFVYSVDKEYGFCGCFVRKTVQDRLSFKSLSKCIQEFNKMNDNFRNYDYAFNYVAFQWVNESDYSDNSINQKIITILINYLRDVEVYVCRGTFKNTTRK